MWKKFTNDFRVIKIKSFLKFLCVNNTIMTENNDDDYDRGTESRDSFFLRHMSFVLLCNWTKLILVYFSEQDWLCVVTFLRKKKTWHTDNKLISDKAAYHSSSRQDSPRTPGLHKATPGGYINNEMLFRETCICTRCIKYIYTPLYFCAFSKICKTVYIAFKCVTSNGKKFK